MWILFLLKPRMAIPTNSLDRPLHTLHIISPQPLDPSSFQCLSFPDVFSHIVSFPHILSISPSIAPNHLQTNSNQTNPKQLHSEQVGTYHVMSYLPMLVSCETCSNEIWYGVPRCCCCCCFPWSTTQKAAGRKKQIL